MRGTDGKFLKGHVTNKPLKEKFCQMCGKKIITRLYTQKYCGSAQKKTGCSFKNSRVDKRLGKQRKEKECESCNMMFIPTGNNQKLCGKKTLKESCSWRRANHKQDSLKSNAPWLKGMTIKIT
jgi:hypothetical protein